MRKRIAAAMALTLTLLAPATGARADNKFLTITTFSQGGNWFLVGGAIADQVNQYVESARMTAVPSSGVIENIQLLNDGQADMAFVLPTEAYDAVHGLGRWEKPVALRQMWNWDVLSHTTPVALSSSGIKMIDDLKGKRVSVGAPGSSSLTNSTAILALHDISFDDITPLYYGLGETVSGLKDGTVDAAIITLTTPAAAILDLTTTEEITFLDFGPGKLEALTEQFPFFSIDTLGADTYRGIAEGGQQFPAYSAITIAHESMDEDTAYAITAAIFDHLDQFGKVHKTAAQHSLKGAVKAVPIPMHPGAEKYFREKGVLD